MITNWRRLIWFSALLLLGSRSAFAALPIDVEVVSEPGVPLTAPQQWARLLGAMDLGSIRIREARANDRPGIRQDGRRYRVVAVLNGSGELVLEGRRYRTSDRAAISKFFKSLAEEESFGEQKGIFGLTQKQFGHVYADLSRPIAFSTHGVARANVVSKIIASLAEPVELESGIGSELRRARPVEIELRGMSAGTGLAIILREVDLIVRPEKLREQAPRLVIEREKPKTDSWPTGWKIEGSPRKAAPQMFEFLTVEIEGYTLDQALEALEPRMAIPLILDRRTLQRRKIDPKTVEVKLPPTKTYLKKSVDRLLSQARLAAELRVDERGKPFCWVTQFGKDSRRAE